MNDLIDAARLADQARKNVATIIHGQEKAVDHLLIALATGGHSLLDGVPGVGKTTLAKTFAMTAGLEFKRVQLTPDLMPSDITGHTLYNQGTHKFEVRRGPAFTNILLVDEINRAPPRTQSALLEVMEERQVTIEGTSLKVPDPFLVIATKNPIDIEGVYPLPEAQLDRFMLFIHMAYPPRAVERAMLIGKLGVPSEVPPTTGLVPALRKAMPQVRVHPDIVDYLLDIVTRTRSHEGVELGAGPRAAEHLLAASRAAALLDARAYVLPDDVKHIAPDVLAHRLILNADEEIRGTTKESVIRQILEQVEVPIGEKASHAPN